jgi:hypothetical protein
MNHTGDGVAFETNKSFDIFTNQALFVMNQYSNEKFSFDEYGFPALEFLLARYFGHLIRVKEEK